MSKVLYDKQGSIVRITLNRPEAMNAYDLETANLLIGRLKEYDADPELRVAIITGNGSKAFCAGADLKSIHGAHEDGIKDLWDPLRQNRLGQSLQVAKPLIAAINGYCLAGGLELALGCDIRIASSTASFGSPEVRWSVLHGFGAMRLPTTVGMSMAMEMLLTGERVSAQRAWEIGLVSRIVEPDSLLGAAEEIADRIAENGPIAIRLVKELAIRGLTANREELLRLYGAFAALNNSTADAKEGPRAFAEKRKPNFKNC